MRVLVAGDRGYIGAVLVPLLRAAGHEVDGLDLGLYEGCDLGPAPDDLGGRRPRDMRDVEPGELEGYDAVACLAALSNDPLGDLNRAATFSVNLDGTLQLARAAKQATSHFSLTEGALAEVRARLTLRTGDTDAHRASE